MENMPIDMPFEEALAALEDVVRRLESGKVNLDEAVTAYERGMQLKKHCEGKLKEAKLRIDKISLNADGSVSLSPFDEKKDAGSV